MSEKRPVFLFYNLTEVGDPDDRELDACETTEFDTGGDMVRLVLDDVEIPLRGEVNETILAFAKGTDRQLVGVYHNSDNERWDPDRCSAANRFRLVGLSDDRKMIFYEVVDGDGDPIVTLVDDLGASESVELLHNDLSFVDLGGESGN